MRRQKKIRSLKMPYARQQTIYRTCQCYKEQPPRIRERIDRLCFAASHGDEKDCNALFAVLTTEKPIRRIAAEHYMSETKLYKIRKRFYEMW